jgi:hypothetical protein
MVISLRFNKSMNFLDQLSFSLSRKDLNTIQLVTYLTSQYRIINAELILKGPRTSLDYGKDHVYATPLPSNLQKY